MADKILKSLNFGTEDDYYFAQSADKINGVISVENGGFGATTTKEARQNIGAASEIDLDKIYDNFRCMELRETDDGNGNLTIGLVNLLNSCIPLEYLQSTGKQHIDLGIKPSDDMEFEIEYQSLAARATKLFGCENTPRSLFDAYNVGKTQATIRVFAHSGAHGGSPTEITTIAGQKTSLKLIVKNGTYSVYVNGELVATSPAAGTVPNLSIFLFAVNRNGKADGGGSQIIYGCRVKKSGKQVGDFRPYLNNNGEAGMYNTVSRKFHKNLGTGEFIAGYGIDSYVHDKMISLADAECGLDGSTLKNLVGDNYDMTITGSLPYADKGLTFNGTTNNYINVPEFTELANTAEVTFEMVMNLTNIQDTQRFLYLKDFFEFFIRSGKLNSDLHFDGEPRENLQGTANIGFITFAAVFKANSYQRLFINGAKVATTSAGSPSSVPASGTIGGNGYAISGGSKFYNMRVYKRALTDKEIARNYEIDKVRFGLDETVSAVSTLSLDESDYSIDEDTELSE